MEAVLEAMYESFLRGRPPGVRAARCRRGVPHVLLRLSEFQARHHALAEHMATEIDLPASAQSVPATRCAGRSRTLVTQRKPARSAPTSVRPTSRCCSRASRTPTALAGDLQPVLRKRYVSTHPRRAATAEAEPAPRPAARLRAARATEEAARPLTEIDGLRFDAELGDGTDAPERWITLTIVIISAFIVGPRQHRAQCRDPHDPAASSTRRCRASSGSITGYALTFATLLIIGGRLGDVYGHRRVFVIGAALFGIGFASARRSRTPSG